MLNINFNKSPKNILERREEIIVEFIANAYLDIKNKPYNLANFVPMTN